MRSVFFAVLLIYIMTAGCAETKPMVRMEQNVSLSMYQKYEVMAVSNDTGKNFEFDVADYTTQELKSQLKAKGYALVEGDGGGEKVLLLSSSLVAYEPGSAAKRWLVPGAGTTQATVRTTLIDKHTGKRVGEMVIPGSVGQGGLFSIGADKGILKTIAEEIVKELDARVKGK